MSKHEIMVIDDTVANLNILDVLLKEAGYSVRAASIVELALQSATAHPPALVLLDIRMPEMDGFEVCRRLKRNARTLDIPVIFISAMNEVSDRVRGFEVGGVDFISKPFQREEVLARVKTHLALREVQERLEQRVKERTSELEHTIEALRASQASRLFAEQRLELALEAVGDGAWDWNPATDAAFFSKRWHEMIGYAENEFHGSGSAWLAQLHPDDQERVVTSLQEYLGGDKPFYFSEFRMRCKNGDWKWMLVRGRLITRDPAGKPLRMIGTQSDISERKNAEAELRIAATAFDAQEGMVITDDQGLILRVNRSFCETTGYATEEVLGRNPSMLQSGRHDAEFYREMWDSIQRTGAWRGEIWDRRKGGEIYPKWLNISAVKNAEGKVTHYVGSHIDITERKKAQEKINHLAYYDPLTKLPNRRLFLDRLQQALVYAVRSGKLAALLFIDLDNFKTLNDTLGHDTGDLLLQQVGQRLTSCVRDGDTVARLGGDEFMVVLESLSEFELVAASQTESICEKVMQQLGWPYQLGIHHYRCTPSIGVTVFHGAQYSIEELMKQADIAMYQAKQSGRNRVRFFDLQMQAKVEARASLEKDLALAIEKNQFQLHYQIQVDAQNQALGAETLVRWQHPERGLVMPLDFIALAEETGLILPIGQWVLESACAQLKKWEADECHRHLSLAVNVSAKQFHQSDFAQQVKATVARYGINPQLLKLELTESMLAQNVAELIVSMNELKDAGIQFSMDDFGTGYSSLQYLKRLPLSQLKIDRSFVHDMGFDSNDNSIVKTIIAVASSLNLNVIAEGVETQAQRELLLRDGCTHYQGFLFSKPLPIEQFEALLKHYAP